MSPVNPASGEAGGSGQPAAGNLYSKSAQQPRSRHTGLHRVDSAGDPPVRRAGNSNPARKAMLDNVRRFSVFSIAMIAITYLSIKGLFIIWNAKDREMRRESAVSAAAGAPPRIKEATPAPPANTRASTAPEAKPNELDTEAIRRAVFISKRGKSLEQAGQYQEAIARYREALEIWPYLTDVWAQIGSLYLKVKDYPKAQMSLEKAVENNPSDAKVLNDLGVAHLHLGQTDKAAKVFEAALEIDPQYASSSFNMALCQLANKDRAAARDYFDQYLRQKPEDPRALREIAFLDASDNKLPEAMRSLERAIVEAPDWPLLYFDAAATSALMGRADDAIHYLEQAESLTSATTVFRLYQEPAFKEIRLSELGHDFEKDIAERVKTALTSTPAAVRADVPNASEPISSASPGI